MVLTIDARFAQPIRNLPSHCENMPCRIMPKGLFRVDASNPLGISLDMEATNVIRAVRERLGESQETFGRRFGVAQTTILDWERNGPPRRGPGRVLLDRMLPELEAEADCRSSPAPAAATAVAEN